MLLAATVLCFAQPFLMANPSETGQNPDLTFENQVRQIVSEEVNRAFEKYSGASKNVLKPEELTNLLIPIITDQVVKRALPLITNSSQDVSARGTSEALVLMRVGDQDITLDDAAAEYLKMPQRSRSHISSFEKLKEFLNDVVLVNRLILIEAESRKLRDRSEIKVQLEKAYENLLIEFFYNQKKDEAAKATALAPGEASTFYEENKTVRFQIKDCVKLANIFVRIGPDDSTGKADSASVQLAREKIEKAKAELDIGTPFEEVWKKYSDDREHENGVIGIFRKDMYSKNSVISEAFSRNRGEYTNIIRGNNGFYILKVLEKNDSKTIPLSDVKTIIEGELKVRKENEYLGAWLDNIKAKYNIRIYKDRVGGSPDTIEVVQPTSSFITRLEPAGIEQPSKNESSENELTAPEGPDASSASDKNSSKKVSAQEKKSGSKKEKRSEKGKEKSRKKTASRDKSEKARPSAGQAAAKPSGKTEDLNEVLAEVDGNIITRLMYNETISQLPGSQAKELGKMSERLQVLDKLINRIIFKKEALLAQIQNDPGFKKELRDIENKILARALIFEDVTRGIEPTAADVKSHFDRNNTEYRARHILFAVKNTGDAAEVESVRAKALAAHSRITAADFAQAARQYSDDVSKNDGGMLPPFTYDDMVEPFSDAVKALKAGEISKPVLTNFGFHIIMLESARALDFNDVKGRIKEKLIPVMQKKNLLGYIDKLKARYGFKFFDDKIRYVIDNKLFQR